MFPTAEIRWFFRANIAAEISDWFHRFDDGPEKFEPRTDHYLRIQDNDSMGIKIREGRLEIKKRHGESETINVFRGQGRLERWQKWGFEIRNPGSINRYLKSFPGEWIGIRKERSQILFGTLESGCGWELTEVQVVGMPDRWWTMGFEAFGRDEDLRKTLLKALEQSKLSSLNCKFDIENSFGYPYWLKTFAWIYNF
jgi:hypothetical protein